MSKWRWVLALLALVMTGVVIPPTNASAEETAVAVAIDSVSLARLDLSKPNDVLSISGTLTNSSSTPITDLSVSFWRATEPILSRTQLDSAVTQARGARLTDATAGNVTLPIENEALQPGQQVRFHVQTTVGALGFTRNDAVYLVGVHVRGISSQGERQTLSRSTIPIAVTTAAAPSASLILLTAPPSQLPTGAFTDNSLVQEITGRLSTLTTSAERAGVIAAIDPALYDAAIALSNDHTVAGKKVAGSNIASGWVERIDALIRQGKVWRLPYGNPDLHQAQAAGELSNAVSREIQINSSLNALPTVAIVRGALNDELKAALASFDNVVVEGGSGISNGKPRYLGASRFDSTSVLDGAQLPRMVAEDFLDGGSTLHLLTTATDATIDQLGPEFRNHISPGAGSAAIRWPSNTDTITKWSELATELQKVRASAAAITDISAETVDLSKVVANSLSADFANEKAAITYLHTVAPPQINRSDLKIVVAQSFVMGSRTNTFPATLTNNLPVPAVVQIRFASEAPQRIWVRATETIRIEPGKSVTVNISPEATTNGVTQVQAQLYTKSGTAVGTPATIEITATDFGRVGWVIIMVSGAVVVGGTAWRIRTIRRGCAKENAS